MLDPAKTQIRYNSEWSDPLGARGMIELAAKYTVARMLERDDFAKRLKAGQGELAVCALKPPIQKIFEIAGFTSLLKTFPTRDEAVAGLA